MRPLLALSALLMLGCATTQSSPTKLSGVEPTPVAGDGSLAGTIAGKVALIDLWATWCEPCTRAVPKLIKLDEAYRAQGLVIVGVNVGEEAEVVQAYAAKAKIGYPLFLDPEFTFADSMAARNVPTLLIVDRSGEIVARHSELSKETLALLRKLLSNG